MKLTNKWNFLSISKERKNDIPKYPRTERCRLFALEYLNYKNIQSLPICFYDLYDVFEDFEWIIAEYNEIKPKMNCEDPYNIKKRKALARTIHKRGSKIFTTIYIKTGYPTRDYYTLAHELGHIILGHFREFEKTALSRQALSKSEYNILEREAEIFAAELIMPMPVLKSFKLKNSADIIKLCGTSAMASQYRFNEIKKFKLTNQIKDIYRNTKIIFSDFINKKACSICGNGFVIKNAKYCPICGTKNIPWGDGKMIYKQIELNEKHKTRICPECQNENTNIDGPFCQICGTHIINECTNKNCGATLDGNARYCPFCGSESTFAKDEILLPWQQEQEQQAQIDFSNSMSVSGDMPF